MTAALAPPTAACPSWCDTGRCAAVDGDTRHRSQPATVTASQDDAVVVVSLERDDELLPWDGRVNAHEPGVVLAVIEAAGSPMRGEVFLTAAEFRALIVELTACEAQLHALGQVTR